MKKLLQPIVVSLVILSLTACKHPGKELETVTSNAVENTDDIAKDIFTDSYGEQMEVAVNHTKNTISVHLDGKTYELKKNEDLPEYTASNAEYQYSDIKGNITFLKKNADMVLFHHKHDKKEQAASKMASY
ncbi:putative MPP superfamily phosphohydrolase [Chryseobacterium sp. H1D6B]|uniref:hypothetical protein n=1 Tax=Chryseobacterium sp. H1D6B TaxID=2940588 RepID=UPI0015CAFC4A|nr:hypothetical protein [Chryseobacterium sp. H1D6B]MDH6252647.1 putative MPP superfamily phosphohydrolase [Chryseobacterium sp. H1D6B]